ncbi:MAG: fructosamine kinase family protein [Gammaproteobacteria bacterium]|nr:fructosamine kinase family protein [Gammaproteobacteria bacterium]
MDRYPVLAQALSECLGARCAPAPARRIGGGCINECFLWESGPGPLFVKLAPRAEAARLESEAAGLAALRKAQALRVPRVLGGGTCAAGAFLALEFIASGPADGRCEALLGAGLARLHAHTADRFGFGADNFIGRTPQANGWLRDWPQFFGARRIAPQLELAARSGHGTLLGAGERVLEAVPALLSGHRPQPALLHGDLWGGNWLAAADGTPVLCDPAVYYGDAEADLAMTRLFGGFGAHFYGAYDAARPASPGWQARAELYNLYHLLNHANLFGGSYVSQAAASMAHLTALTRG